MRHANYGTIYTIGHSLHDERWFLNVLSKYAIEILVDVRSTPYSRRAPQYQRGALAARLGNVGVQYVFAGQSLGGRPANPELYVNGQVSYERVATTESFLSGLRAVAIAARTSRLALMCAEAEPIECHRFLLIARTLHENGFDVKHILSKGELESHSQTEQRMMAHCGLEQTEAFGDTANALLEAYSLQATRFAYANRSGSLHHRTAG